MTPVIAKQFLNSRVVSALVQLFTILNTNSIVFCRYYLLFYLNSQPDY